MEYFVGLVVVPAVLLAVVIVIYVRQRRNARAVWARSLAAENHSLTSPSRPAWPGEAEESAKDSQSRG